MKHPVYIAGYNCVTPLGFSVGENWEALRQNRSGVKIRHFSVRFPQVCAAVIDSEYLDKKFSDTYPQKSFTRLEKMLLLALKPLAERYHITDKSLLILSTTKGNISSLKNREDAPAESFLPVMAQKIADFFGFKTSPVVVSNACVSGVMAVSVAKNLLQSDHFDNAFVIAGDEVTEFVLSGFDSFQAMSSAACRPYDADRNGINIGEAAAAVFVTKTPPEQALCFQIMGDASINDANHISGPSRNGEGLWRSITNALAEAEISPREINYISAHGTATLYNDEMESFAFSRAGLSAVPLNSLKGYYGHCLGASGLLELIAAMESARYNLLIKTLNFSKKGVSQPINIIGENLGQQTTTVLKTASGFGGCNTALILKKRNGKN